MDVEKEIEHIKEQIEDKVKRKEAPIGTVTILLVLISISLMAFNQFQILQAYSGLSGTGISFTGDATSSGTGSFSAGLDLSSVDISQLQSTGHSLAALFPLDSVETTQDAIDVMIPTGTPEYGEELGVSFDDPVGSLSLMARQLWPAMKRLKTEDPEVWQRYINLAIKPVGISCEFCCGVGAIGISSNGEPRCGCQHNPAILALTIWLMKNRPDWSDAEILKEVLKWKTLWFPRNMIDMAVKVAGKSPSSLDELPGMVGGC